MSALVYTSLRPLNPFLRSTGYHAVLGNLIVLLYRPAFPWVLVRQARREDAFHPKGLVASVIICNLPSK